MKVGYPQQTDSYEWGAIKTAVLARNLKNFLDDAVFR